MQEAEPLEAQVNLNSPAQVRTILNELELRPSKALGQNFLVDGNVLEILMRHADVGEQDVVLEVGPGLGTVTHELVERCKRLVAVEKDRRLFSRLRQEYRYRDSVEIINADIMRLFLDELFAKGVTKVVANLPYCVASRFLMNLWQEQNAPEKVVVTIQKEVAERLVAEPGNGQYGLLSIWPKLVYDVEIAKLVSPTCFWPIPEIESAIIVMTRKSDARPMPADMDNFKALTRHAFQHRRKQMCNILQRFKGAVVLTKDECVSILGDLKLECCVRPANLALGDWCRLSDKCAEFSER